MTDQNLPAQLDKDRAQSLLSGGGFLQKIKIGQGLTKEVQKKLAETGDFIFGFGDQQVVLGPKFQCVVGPYRAHALHLVDDNEVEAESFNDQSDCFKRIERRARAGKAQWEQGESAMYGLDFLLWLPSISQFGVYFFCKTAREAAKPLLAAGPGRLATFETVLAETKKFSWYKPSITAIEDATGSPPAPERALAEALELFSVGAGGGSEDAAPAKGPASRPR